MTHAQIIALAFVLDFFLGDPRLLPHPVSMIAWFSQRTSDFTRKVLGNSRFSGVVMVLITLAAVIGVSILLLYLAGMVGSWAQIAISVLLVYFSIAPRDLVRHSMRVFRALKKNDIETARRMVGMMVGRDVDSLSENEVITAAVESVAESTVDGVLAPLIFAFLFGPVGAVVYRAVNTFDSMYGSKCSKNRDFGWASARLDDVLNFIPARVTALIMCFASLLLLQKPGLALQTLFRDGHKHPSPNSGLPEAVVAGALGLQLGGGSKYKGVFRMRPVIGESINELTVGCIKKANGIMYCTALLFVAVIQFI